MSNEDKIRILRSNLLTWRQVLNDLVRLTKDEYKIEQIELLNHMLDDLYDFHTRFETILLREVAKVKVRELAKWFIDHADPPPQGITPLNDNDVSQLSMELIEFITQEISIMSQYNGDEPKTRKPPQ